jgi:hypothetical protein
MIQEEVVLEAIKQSRVSKVAVVDDAFDPPEISDKNGGALLEYMENVDFKAVVSEVGVESDLFERAKQAVSESEYASEDITEFVKRLYDRFSSGEEPRFDPGGIFREMQSDNLKYVKPILKLLEDCDPPIEIIRVGSRPEDLEKVGHDVHLIFIDFYLDPKVSADTSASPAKQRREAKERSIAQVTALVKAQGEKAPSVVLMSRHDVKADAEKFREAIVGDRKSLVFASRFAYVGKNDVSIADDGSIKLGEAAANDLLDIFQSYDFGRSTHAALEAWLDSAGKAVDDLRSEIERLHLKDFAYLIRFRLAQEGQELLEYLEWFFGECLLDALSAAVDKKSAVNDQIKSLNGPEAARIEGAFDGPTAKVAELFHRVRIEAPRDRTKNFRMGDLYLSGQGAKRRMSAVLTPDCDLVKREKDKRLAPRLLILSGKIKSLDAPESTLSDFIMLNDKPHNIVWDRKAIESKEFDSWPEPGKSTDEQKYVGTLRPLYAQELQRTVLHDLGRVGISVAPAFGMTAKVSVNVHMATEKKDKIEVDGGMGSACYVIPSRGGGDKPIVMFTRRFVSNLIDKLAEIDSTLLAPHAAGNLSQIKRPEAYAKLSKMFRTGVRFEETIDMGIFLTSRSAMKASDSGTWCWLAVDIDELD